MTLLDIQDLATYYELEGDSVKAVDGVSFSLERGKTLGLVGESGCGKTSVMLSILRLLPENGKIVRGKILLDGRDLVSIPEDEMREIRWKKISIVFQNAMNALNPVFKVRDQIAEPIIAHEGLSKQETERKVSSLFELVGLPSSHMKSYPHELSGGMKQRVMIAMSLACNPDLVIADEPVTALDVVVQDQIIQKIKEMQTLRNFSMIVVSHDISVIAETCESIAVMYGGRIFEYGDSLSVFHDPHHPYTIGLLGSFPTLRGAKAKLVSIEGNPPDLLNPQKGCLFQPRCPRAEPICKTRPPKISVKGDHFSECHFALDPELRKIQFVR